MAAFQWVVLLSMVAIASSCHIPLKSCSCKKGGIGGGVIGGGIVPVKGGHKPIAIPIGKVPIGKVPIGKVPIGKVPIVIKGGGRGFINLGIFVSGLSSIVRSAKDIINDVIEWKINTIFDVFHIVISLSRSCGIIIDVFISGLGTLFGNLVIAIYKILICVVGLPRIGGIIGSRDICRDDYGCKYGWRRYPGKYSNHIDILKHYGVYDARVQCENILKRWTKGGGIDKLDYSSRIVYERVSRLSDLVARDYKSWCLDDFSEVYFSVTMIVGVFASRYRSGLGLKIVDEIQEIFTEQFRSQNIDITSSTIRIKKSLETIEESQWSGVFVDSKESSQQDTSVRQESDKEENRETNTRRDNKTEKDNERRESENNEKDSTNKQETKEICKSDEQASGQKSEKTDNSSENDSSNSESKRSKSGEKSSDKYTSKVEIDDSSSKKASADNKSSSIADTNTETVDNNGENRSKSSSSSQTSQESNSEVSEEKKLKVSKEVNEEKVDEIY